MFKIKKGGNIPAYIDYSMFLFFSLSSTLIVLFFLRSALAEQTSPQSSEPKKIVEKFCQLDAEGKRLSSETWEDLSPLVTWTEEITAGELNNVIHIISGFSVKSSTAEDSTAQVSVEYRNLGSTDTTDFSRATKSVETIIFHLVKQEGLWKIDKPVLAPHVSWKAAVAYLRQRAEQKPLVPRMTEKKREKIMQETRKKTENVVKKIEDAAKQTNAK